MCKDSRAANNSHRLGGAEVRRIRKYKDFKRRIAPNTFSINHSFTGAWKDQIEAIAWFDDSATRKNCSNYPETTFYSSLKKTFTYFLTKIILQKIGEDSSLLYSPWGRVLLNRTRIHTSCFSSLGLIHRLTVATTKYEIPNLWSTPGILHFSKLLPANSKKTLIALSA